MGWDLALPLAGVAVPPLFLDVPLLDKRDPLLKIFFYLSPLWDWLWVAGPASIEVILSRRIRLAFSISLHRSRKLQILELNFVKNSLTFDYHLFLRLHDWVLVSCWHSVVDRRLCRLNLLSMYLLIVKIPFLVKNGIVLWECSVHFLIYLLFLKCFYIKI